MCFYKRTKRKKATEDIVVWKIMERNPKDNRKVMSFLYHDEDKYPNGYSIGDTIKADWRFCRNKWLNAFLIDHMCTVLTGEVVHAYISSTSDIIRDDLCVVKLIIPAGNYYWTEDENDQIVSTSMIIESIEY